MGLSSNLCTSRMFLFPVMNCCKPPEGAEDHEENRTDIECVAVNRAGENWFG